VPLNEELLTLLACPLCKGGVRLADTGDALVCDCCGRRHAIRNGIVVMICDTAHLDEDECDSEQPESSAASVRREMP